MLTAEQLGSLRESASAWRRAKRTSGRWAAADRRTHSVLGPLVNRAARLQARALAGQVLADQATQRRTHQAFRYRSLHSDETPEQAQTYAVEGAQPRPAKTRGIEGLRAELIGRDEELAKLEAALASVRAGQGQMVSLISEAGLGKSRLVAELKARCDSLEAATSSSMGDQSALDNPQLRNHLAGRPLPGNGDRARRMGRSWTCCTVISRATDAARGEPPALAAAHPGGAAARCETRGSWRTIRSRRSGRCWATCCR